jgi:hypothetical protein
MNLPPSGEWVSGGFDVPVAAAPSIDVPTVSVPRPPARLSIVLPFIEREIPRVLRLLDYMEQLSGQLKRTVYLLPFKGLDIRLVTSRAEKAFADVQVIKDSEGVSSDWVKDEKIRDAAGPNSLFRQAAWYFHFKPMLGPWLYLEPDCVPLVATWDDQLEAAYRLSGRPFLGAPMKWQNGDEYLNGAAIYPQNAVTLAPLLVTRTMWNEFPEKEIAFDIAGGPEVLRRSNFTDLIQLEYRSDAPAVRNGAVLFHGDRSGKLFETLSGGDAVGTRRQLETAAAEEIKQAASSRAQKSSKRKGDEKHDRRKSKSRRTNTPAKVATNGAADVPAIAPAPTFQYPAPTLGDEIRHGVNLLVTLSNGQASRKARILRELRKARLAPR